MGEKCGAKCEVYSRVCGYFRPVANWNKGKREEFHDRKSFRVVAVPVAMALLLTLFEGGCAAVDAVTASTREKSIAAGSDTWGGGVEAKTATADCPVPGVECWFGRRKVWYTSVHDRATGLAAAEIVRVPALALGGDRRRECGKRLFRECGCAAAMKKKRRFAEVRAGIFAGILKVNSR